MIMSISIISIYQYISLAPKKQVKELYHQIVDELYKWEDETDEW